MHGRRPGVRIHDVQRSLPTNSVLDKFTPNVILEASFHLEFILVHYANSDYSVASGPDGLSKPTWNFQRTSNSSDELRSVVAIALISVDAVSIDHDKVGPLAQPEAVAVSEKAAVKFKSRLLVNAGCTSFPVINTTGRISGGLKGNSGSEGCDAAPLGSQVYGRATWLHDVWAIMYAWHFSKGFRDGSAFCRHDGYSAVVWINNYALKSPKVPRLSLSTSKDSYKNRALASFINGTTPFLLRYLQGLGNAALITMDRPGGAFQDVIMWSN